MKEDYLQFCMSHVCHLMNLQITRVSFCANHAYRPSRIRNPRSRASAGMKQDIRSYGNEPSSS
jgi:hypothetical protein